MFKHKQKRVSVEGDCGSCDKCGTPKILIPWNDKVDILVCDNSHCATYRNPAGTVANRSRESHRSEESSDG